jgi:hypothetical protein
MEPQGQLPYPQEPTLDPILSQANPVHTLTPHILKIHVNICA